MNFETWWWKRGSKDQWTKRGDEKHYLFLLNKDRVTCTANSEKRRMVPCPSVRRNLDEGRGWIARFRFRSLLCGPIGFVVSSTLPPSLRKNAKDWWCTKVRFRAALYKKRRDKVMTWHVRSKRERGFLSTGDFRIGGGVRAFLGMGVEALGNLILLHCSSLVWVCYVCLPRKLCFFWQTLLPHPVFLRVPFVGRAALQLRNRKKKKDKKRGPAPEKDQRLQRSVTAVMWTHTHTTPRIVEPCPFPQTVLWCCNVHVV